VKITTAPTCFLFPVAGLTARGAASGPTIRLKPKSLAGEGNKLARGSGRGPSIAAPGSRHASAAFWLAAISSRHQHSRANSPASWRFSFAAPPERSPSFGVRESDVALSGGGAVVRKVSEYRQHADECRTLARRARAPEHRDMLLNMAATWDSLAEERIKSRARRQRIANLERTVQTDRLNHR